MELRQLEYFVAVAEEANFTRAAARVHVAQPGVSAQIRRLERELGQELLDRTGRSVRLTEAGAAVLPYARAALGAVASARLAVEELAGLVRGHVALGMVTSHSVPLPALLAEFHAQHPAVEITLAEANSDQLIDGLHTGRLDAAIVAIGATEPPGLHLHVLNDEPILAAVGHQHELAGRTSITLAALREQPLICLPAGSGIRSHLDEACRAAGFTPRIACEASNPALLAELAACGLGVAILPGSLARAHTDLRALSIRKPELRGRLVFAWRADRPISPAARALVNQAVRMLGTPSVQAG